MESTPDPNPGDLYEVLGVLRSAPSDEIKRAYLALVRQYTPERAPEAFKRIREAYETLSNPELRKQYDTRPDPRIAALLNQASEAMRVQDYWTAEQAYKRVLLEVPGLHRARNLLGLCFLHQQQPDQAIAQYERLLRESSADASTHANAAHAYRMVKRFEEAEREFRAAIRLGGDQVVEHVLALIQMTIDRGNADGADKLALAQINAAPRGSLAAAEYGAKRIELALLLGRKVTIPALLAGMSKDLSTEDQRRRTANAMGKAAGRLIASEVFQIAEQVAKASRTLQPADPQFDALEQASHLLYLNDFDGVARLFNTHVSFANTGALQPLKPVIERYCTTHAVFKGIQPISSPPSFFRFYGIGTTILGHKDDDPQTGTHVVTQYFTFFFVPLFPVALYRVRSVPNNKLLFLGRSPLGRREKIHLRVGVVAVLVVWILVALSDQKPSGRNASTPSSTGYAGLEPAAGRSAEPFSVYDGEAVNTTLPASPIRSNIRLTLKGWLASPNGYLTVYPPLGGSGPCFLEARGDSIRFATISLVGDTILWFGVRTGDAVVGDYRIVGGQFKTQHGTWHARLASGTPIPRQVNPW